ncbi:hypothetical protein D3C81_1214840 [compost metagenome]
MAVDVHQIGIGDRGADTDGAGFHGVGRGVAVAVGIGQEVLPVGERLRGVAGIRLAVGDEVDPVDRRRVRARRAEVAEHVGFGEIQGCLVVGRAAGVESVDGADQVRIAAVAGTAEVEIALVAGRAGEGNQRHVDGDPHQRIFMQHVDQRGLGVDQLAALHAAGHVQHHGEVHLRRRLWHQAARRVVVGGRAIVAEDQLAAKIQRNGVLVAVTIDDGADQADLAGADAERVVRVTAIGMLQGNLLVQLQFAGGSIQREAEGRRPAGATHASLDHRRADLVQHDRLAGRGGQAAVHAIAHRQAVAGAAAIGTC